MSCPAFGHECYNCHSTSHFTALCRRPCTNRHLVDNSSKQRSQEEGPAGPVAADIPVGLPAEVSSLAETTPTTPEEASAPAAAHHKTITKEDHPNVEDTAPHHIGIRLAILNHLIPIPKLVKVNSSPIGQVMAIYLFIQCCS